MAYVTNQPPLNSSKSEIVIYNPVQRSAINGGQEKKYTISMFEAPVDPMEPPKFKINSKIPRGPPSPPAPVVHSPPRKATKQELAEWNVPPCVSNWKNNRGYSIPLANRVAADGRGLQQTHVNEKFARLSEALSIAERNLRASVDARHKLEKQAEQKRKEQEEVELQKIAQVARQKRAALASDGPLDKMEQERNEMRRERAQDRVRERNLAKSGAAGKSAALPKDRDVSEMIALGIPNAGRNVESEEDRLFDRRLFNQTSGLDSGFAGGADDLYNVYDEPWRAENSLSQQIYRPAKNKDDDIYGGDLDQLRKQKRFVADKPFEGAEGTTTGREAEPVQFEKDEHDDPFNLNQWLSYVKKGEKQQSSTNHEPTSKRRK